ncbi:MAG: M24 family metallopeptidase [Candidatus Dormibacteraceae bacterium]
MTLAAPPVVSTEWAWSRVQRLREKLKARSLGAALIHDPISAKHLLGATSAHGWPTLGLIEPERVTAVFFATKNLDAACNAQVLLRGIRHDRVVKHTEELVSALQPLLDAASGHADAIGVDMRTVPAWATQVLSRGRRPWRVVDISDDLIDLRRTKDPDELAVIQFNVNLSEAAYQAARDTIRPGVTEVEVHLAMTRAVNVLAGTTAPFGGDFMSGPGGGETGGPPSNHVLEEGESYVIDFWPWFGGYFSDMCRTFAVGKPSVALRAAVRHTIDCLEVVEKSVKPGARAADVDIAIRQFLWRKPDLGGDAFRHIAGHGLGIAPHEAPWIISESNDVIRAGDVITLEPGLYAESLRGGARTEDSYLVTADGLRNLCHFPRDLV